MLQTGIRRIRGLVRREHREKLVVGGRTYNIGFGRGVPRPKGVQLSPDRRWMYYKGMWLPAMGGGAYDSPKDLDYYFEDFHGDLIPDELATSSDTGTITCNVGLSGGGAERASILRLDNTNDGDNDMAEVDLGAVYFSVQDGQMFMEARVLLERLICGVNVGFNDETLEGANTLPVELSGTTFTLNAGTYIGVVYDSNATNDNWHVIWADDSTLTSVAIANLNSGFAVAAGDWYTIRILVEDAGSGNRANAQLWISDGTNSFQYRATDTIDRDQAMVPHLAVENRTTTGAFLDIDYIEAGRNRQNTAP